MPISKRPLHYFVVLYFLSNFIWPEGMGYLLSVNLPWTGPQWTQVLLPGFFVALWILGACLLLGTRHSLPGLLVFLGAWLIFLNLCSLTPLPHDEFVTW